MALELIRKMKPFYLRPLPTSDSKPYVINPTMERPWSQKPSFLMVYFLINGKIITKDCMVKGGPVVPRYVEWKFYDDRIVWYSNLQSPTPEEHIWYLGKDYELEVTENVDRFAKYKRSPVVHKCQIGNPRRPFNWKNSSKSI